MSFLFLTKGKSRNAAAAAADRQTTADDSPPTSDNGRSTNGQRTAVGSRRRVFHDKMAFWVLPLLCTVIFLSDPLEDVKRELLRLCRIAKKCRKWQNVTGLPLPPPTCWPLTHPPPRLWPAHESPAQKKTHTFSSHLSQLVWTLRDCNPPRPPRANHQGLVPTPPPPPTPSRKKGRVT